MLRRALLALANTVVLGAALVVLLFFPAYSAYAVFGLMGWLAASLTLALSGWTVRSPAGAASATATPGSSALPGGAPIDFCIFCGTTFAPGERTCRSCGHALPRPAVVA